MVGVKVTVPGAARVSAWRSRRWARRPSHTPPVWVVDAPLPEPVVVGGGAAVVDGVVANLPARARAPQAAAQERATATTREPRPTSVQYVPSMFPPNPGHAATLTESPLV